jgi:hypothetical protein
MSNKRISLGQPRRCAWIISCRCSIRRRVVPVELRITDVPPVPIVREIRASIAGRPCLTMLALANRSSAARDCSDGRPQRVEHFWRLPETATGMARLRRRALGTAPTRRDSRCALARHPASPAIARRRPLAGGVPDQRTASALWPAAARSSPHTADPRVPSTWICKRSSRLTRLAQDEPTCASAPPASSNIAKAVSSTSTW